MKGGLKTYQAPSDPNLGELGTKALSYAIPSKWSELSGGTGNFSMPASFPRGTSNCIGIAEATCGEGGTKLVSSTTTTYNAARFDKELTAKGKWNGNASCFQKGGCQVVLMDGSVRIVPHAAAADFIIAADPKDTTTIFSKEW